MESITVFLSNRAGKIPEKIKSSFSNSAKEINELLLDGIKIAQGKTEIRAKAGVVLIFALAQRILEVLQSIDKLELLQKFMLMGADLQVSGDLSPAIQEMVTEFKNNVVGVTGLKEGESQ